jgi:hypothetical protein
MRTPLTDPQVWTVLPLPRASDEELPAMLGTKVSAVHNARWNLALKGWTCSIRYAPCRHCGELATLPGASRTHAYHAKCRPLALAEELRRLDADRPVTPEKIAKILEWGHALQEQTRHEATNAYTRWTEDEDVVVLPLMDLPLVETCEELRRSWRLSAIGGPG